MDESKPVGKIRLRKCTLDLPLESSGKVRLTTKLHRVNIAPEVIEKNLEPLRQNLKKKIAQQIYYNNVNTGNSPMLKGNIRARLGKVPFHGTNTSMVPPKPFRRYGGTQNRIIRRNYSAQERINQIRRLNRINNNRNRKIVGQFNNLRVEVVNNSVGEYICNCQRKFRQILNKDLQMAIREIKSSSSNLCVPITTVAVHATDVTMFERVAMYSKL